MHSCSCVYRHVHIHITIEGEILAWRRLFWQKTWVYERDSCANHIQNRTVVWSHNLYSLMNNKCFLIREKWSMPTLSHLTLPISGNIEWTNQIMINWINWINQNASRILCVLLPSILYVFTNAFYDSNSLHLCKSISAYIWMRIIS